MFDKIVRVASHFEKNINNIGCEVHISTDFLQMKTAVDNLGDHITPHFNPKFNTFFREFAFWIGLYSESECVGMCACKLQPLGTENLASYIQRYWLQTYGPDSLNEIKFAAEQKDSLRDIKGNLVYAGEFRVSKDFARTRLNELLLDYAKLAIFSHWPNTDFIYLFTRKRDARRGMFSRTGMNRVINDAINWEMHPSQAEPDYSLGLLDRQGFEEWLIDELRFQAEPELIE